ncbi:MAG: endonuclease/exonuclease/phosphatase family protein [Planctomycetales bacterium]|nr:endonuclease/exonuclease/phosphatase family protein [Planctomycetales bacterium]
MRSLPITPMMVLFLIGLGGYLGCDPNTLQAPLDVAGEGAEQGAPPSGYPTSASVKTNGAPGAPSMPERQASTILLGSFNMQRLGPTKLADPWVMDRFATIIRHYDIIALQEITSQDQTTLPQLLKVVNANGGNYSYTISPRIGRESSGYYEQYAYVFDANRIRGGDNFCYVVQDDADMLNREPFVGRFETITNGQPFSFSLINIHTSPGEIQTELDVLADVFVNVTHFEYPQDDIILLGDLNADPARFQNLGKIPGVVPALQDITTNTRRNQLYDNFVFNYQAVREFTGRAGVFDMQDMFQLSMSDTLRISDHQPIWAEFSINEQPNGFTATSDSRQVAR